MSKVRAVIIVIALLLIVACEAKAEMNEIFCPGAVVVAAAVIFFYRRML